MVEGFEKKMYLYYWIPACLGMTFGWLAPPTLEWRKNGGGRGRRNGRNDKFYYFSKKSWQI